jgi:hypothetical protein
VQTDLRRSLPLRIQPPEGSSMGEADGVHKRRMFRWPKEARELARQYKERTSRSQEHHEAERRTLVTKLAEISGNPRDACLRFLRELGVNQKRAYREWTKPEQQRLLDLITAMPVEEAAKILRRPVGSVRSMLHRLGMGGKSAPFESPFAPSAVSTFTTNFVLVTVDKCT